MTPQEIATSYDKLADYWNGDAFDRTNGIEAHRRALRFVAARGHAIDIGCGSSGRIVELMLAEGFEVEGLDVSREMVRLARLRHPAASFRQADIREWVFPHRYDFISAWDSIWHVPLADQEAVLQKLCAALNPAGVLVFTTGGVDTPGEQSNPFLGEPLYHAAPGIPKVLETISRGGCVCRHLEYDQLPEPHVHLIVQKARQAE